MELIVLLALMALPGFGALAIVGTARLAGRPARLVIGLGPRVAGKGASPGRFDVRRFPFWLSAVLDPDPTRPSLWLVRAMGPLTTLVAPLLLLCAIVASHGVPDPDAPLMVDVRPGSAAERDGLVGGDVLVAIEGEPVETMDEVREIVSARPGLSTRISIERGSTPRDVAVTPSGEVGAGRLGVTQRQIFRAPSAAETVTIVLVSLRAGYQAMLDVVSPRSDSLRGPVAMELDTSAPADRTAWIVVYTSALWLALVAPLVSLFVAIGQVRQALAKPTGT